MKTFLSKITLGAFLLMSFSFINTHAACDYPAFTEGADRNYAAGDIISRNGVDYKVTVPGWANASGSDWAYAPGTGTNWNSAWSLENDPCIDTGGGGGGATCSDGIQNQDETGIDCGGTKCSACSGGGGETCSDGIQNQDETGVDCGGATCSPCGGGGGGGGSSCTSVTDDGQAEATFYKLLEDGRSTVVTCSFDAVNDIKGTYYGALETATLHETPAKYCGMCVSMTGVGGTATVHVVDECPDCNHHNTGDTDIDLSPQAFAAVVGDESIGRSAITWSEISCPWVTPIHVIVQGSNQWYAKVIIGNTVNRVALVEVQQAGSWYALTRGSDNGWVSTGVTTNEVSKSFRITDIYGEQIEVSGISFSANPTDSKTDGPSNFSSCSVSSSQNIDPLDYVSVYPNPAIDEVTIAGITGVTNIEVINSVGRVVGSQALNGNVDQASLNVSNLSSGIYFLKMNSRTGVYSKTFVK